MEHFWSDGLWDFLMVGEYFLSWFDDLMNNIYESDYGWLFYMALLPPLMMFIFDLAMTFVLSVRCRELRFFNVVSPKSWHMLNNTKNSSLRNTSIIDNKLKSPLFFIRSFSLSPFAMRLSYKKAKNGDIIRSKDGLKSVYAGCKLTADGKTLYKYRTNNGIYFSTLKPYQWAISKGSQRMDSVVNKSD